MTSQLSLCPRLRPRPLAGGAAALLAAGLGLLPLGGRAQTLYNGSGGLVAVTDSVLYVRGDAGGAAVENAGEFNLTGSGPNARPRLFLDEGGLLSTSGATWVPGRSTVVFNGASGTTRTLNLNGGLLFNLRVDNPAGGAASAPGGVQLGSNQTVANGLRMAQGFLFTRLGTVNYSLTLAAAARVQGEQNLSYVRGSLVQQQSLSGNTPNDFGGMGFSVNPQGQSFTLQVDRRSGVSVVNYSTGRNFSTGNTGIDRIWALTSAAPPSQPVTLTLTWLTANDNGLDFAGNLAQVFSSVDQGATWQRVGLPQQAVPSGQTRTVTVTGAVTGSIWYTVSTRNQPLPVQLTAFTATAQGLDAQLSWTTATEVNSNYFVVERSLDGTAWRDVTSVPAAGNSASPRNYSATDAGAGRLGSLLYYRLRQVDTDGKTAYAPVRTVQFVAVATFSVQAFPVPMRDFLTVDLLAPEAGPAQLELYDAVGRRVVSRSADAPAGSSRYQLDVHELATGTYVLRVRLGSHLATQRLTRE